MLSRLLAEDSPEKKARTKPAVGGKLITKAAVGGKRKMPTKPAVGGKRQKRASVAKQSIVGSVHESDTEHWQRHSAEHE